MNQNPHARTTIAMCTYNGERYLSEQIDSILAQTRLPDVWLIADDRSKDATWDLLQRYAPRIRGKGIELELYQNPENLGYVANFESVLRRANAEIVFLADQDDIWHAHKLQTMTDYMRDHPDVTLLHTNARIVDSDGSDKGYSLFEALEITQTELAHIHSGNAFDVLIRRNVVTGATTAIRGHFIQQLDRFSKDWVHDEWLAVMVSVAGKMDCLEEPLIDYRQHANNQIGVKLRTWHERYSNRLGRRDHLRQTVQRMQVLLKELKSSRLSKDRKHVQLIEDRLQHAMMRAELSGSMLIRGAQVGREVLSGRYMKYSNGLRSVAVDLFGLK